MAKLYQEPTDSEIREKLRRQFLPPISVWELADEITNLLKSLGRKAGTPERVAGFLANKLAGKFAKANGEVAWLIEQRPRELQDFCNQVNFEDVLRFVNADRETVRTKRSRTKIRNDEERIRGIKKAKNCYERMHREYVMRPGWIEREFGHGFSAALLPSLSEPTGPCLDEIFRGGNVRMCGVGYSLQSLFGLSRKNLSAAGKGIRAGRTALYDFRAVLRCMEVLLHRRPPLWLPDADRRRTVLAGILARVQREATQEIAPEFERILRPHVS